MNTTDFNLQELARQSNEAFKRLSPIEQIIANNEQKKSFLRGMVGPRPGEVNDVDMLYSEILRLRKMLEEGLKFPTGIEISIDYTNWRGIRAWRRIQPIRIEFTSNKWHPEEQLLLFALDLESSDLDERGFAMSNIHSWRGVKI